jgi:hypothetical protein
MKDIILSVKDVDEKVKNTPLFYIDTNTDIWGDEVSWEYLEIKLRISRLLILDLKTWVNVYIELTTSKDKIQFEIRGLELLLKLREELRGKHKIHYYSDLFQHYMLDEGYE